MAASPHEIVAETLLNIMRETGNVPWAKPWASTGASAPVSFNGARRYRGINRLVLGSVAMARGYRDPRWITYKGAKTAGGSVRKGEKATAVILWKPVTKEDDNGEETTFLITRYYRVFNVEQCEGIELKIPEPVEPTSPVTRNDKAESIVSQYLANGGPSLTHGGDRACYTPATDSVRMPNIEDFVSPDHYYGTLLHELAHSTGHKSRLARKSIVNMQPFGTRTYAEEELIAEIASAFLYGECDLNVDGLLYNSATYVNGWIKKIEDDPKAFVNGCQRASKAADYILNPESETE